MLPSIVLTVSRILFSFGMLCSCLFSLTPSTQGTRFILLHAVNPGRSLFTLARRRSRVLAFFSCTPSTNGQLQTATSLRSLFSLARRRPRVLAIFSCTPSTQGTRFFLLHAIDPGCTLFSLARDRSRVSLYSLARRRQTGNCNVSLVAVFSCTPSTQGARCFLLHDVDPRCSLFSFACHRSRVLAFFSCSRSIQVLALHSCTPSTNRQLQSITFLVFCVVLRRCSLVLGVADAQRSGAGAGVIAKVSA